MSAELPENLRRLLIAHIDSIEQLEVLLLLHRDGTRAWRTDEIATELRTSLESASSRLEDLRRRRLAEGDGQTYTLGRGPEARDVAELATLYRTRRVSVINYIFTKPADRIRSFADAFKLRKDDDNG